MDGTLDTSSEMWRVGSKAAKQLALDISGQLMCPVCSYSETLQNVTDTELFGCARGHRFRLGRVI